MNYNIRIKSLSNWLTVIISTWKAKNISITITKEKAEEDANIITIIIIVNIGITTKENMNCIQMRKILSNCNHEHINQDKNTLYNKMTMNKETPNKFSSNHVNY